MTILQLERYQVDTLLGHGGIGDTFKALDRQTGQWVALKAVSLTAAENWKTIELLEREAEVLQQLKHPGIPAYIDAFYCDDEQDRTYYIVQQLAPGQSLQALVDSGWRATEADVVKIATQLLDILVYLHQHEPPIIHRDIKPQNVIYDAQQDHISLVDFGSVQNTYYSTLGHASTIAGTFGYMAPEQFQGSNSKFKVSRC